MKNIQPRKQRKKMYQAPQHNRYRRFSTPLSSALKLSHNTNSVPVRTGDTVRVMRGDYKGFEGKVNRVDRSKYRIFVEGVSTEKVDGSTVLIPIHPSKVTITQLNLDDKRRKEILKRKGSVSEKAELTKEKPIKEAELPKKKQKRKKKTRKTTTAKPGGE